MKKIPLNIITGFLGSGKTTLVRKLLTENGGRQKIAVLMNEIGEVSIDAKLLEGYSMQTYELNDGCICCQINENFLETLNEIYEKASPDLIIVETTGAANPMSIIYSLLNPDVVLDAVITTVDVKNLAFIQAETEVFIPQIEAADLVVMTKTDIATPEELAAAQRLVAEYNPKAVQLDAAQIGIDICFGVHYPNQHAKLAHAAGHAEQAFLADEHHHEGDHFHIETDGVENFYVASDAVFDLEKLQAYLDHLPKNIWRLKGVVNLSEKFYLLNFAYGRFTIEDYDTPAARTELVFIGKNILSQKETLIRDLNVSQR
jgi:cobalamin biosynthesis protein CobW